MPDLLQQVFALTGRQFPEVTTTDKGWRVAWRRLYADAGWSDERQLTVEHPDINQAWAGIVAWEAVADELEAERGEGGIEAGDPEFWRRLNERLRVSSDSAEATR